MRPEHPEPLRIANKAARELLMNQAKQKATPQHELEWYCPDGQFGARPPGADREPHDGSPGAPHRANFGCSGLFTRQVCLFLLLVVSSSVALVAQAPDVFPDVTAI